MTPEQRNLAFGLVIVPPSGKAHLSREEFSGKFPSALDDGKLALRLLEEAIQAQSPDDLEAALTIGSAFGFSEAHIPPLCELLGANSHFSHENIVSILQGLKAPQAVSALYKAALTAHPYLDYDETFGLARKCTWALADIGTPAALEKLGLLVANENPRIASYAQKRIENWDRERERKGV